MKSLILGLLLLASVAQAQKAYTPTADDLKAMTPPLDQEERQILERGEISTARYVVGGILGTYPLGFGVGHAIQKRYKETGWIFTVGELGSLAVAAAGASTCMEDREGDGKWSKCKSGLLMAGGLSFIGFRIWEIIDLWTAPPSLNKRYRELKARESATQARLFLLPQTDGALLGLQWRF